MHNPVNDAASVRAPRLLLIDHTKVGDGSATGEVKAALFADWPADRLMQLYQHSARTIGFASAGRTRNFRTLADGAPPAKIAAAIDAFAPEIILYRPACLPSLVDFHAAAMRLIYASPAPLAVWIMDDWPAAIAQSQSVFYRAFAADWRALVDLADWRLSIGEAMSRAMEARYAKPFEPFANGVDPADWPLRTTNNSPATIVRYAGSLSETMTLYSVARIAEAVEQLSDNGADMRFEINTRPIWRERAAEKFAPFAHTVFLDEALSREDYRAWLAAADINVIAYNFDGLSKDYVRYSIANKLPECLASGAALLAHGPADVATLEFLADHDAGVRVTEPDVDLVAARLKALAASPEAREASAAAGRRLAFERLNIADIRARFMRAATTAAAGPADARRGRARIESAHLDETHVIASLMSERPAGAVMIDVGAHQGSSLAPFRDRGWRVFAYEPDAANREKLTARFGDDPAVTIDARAVGETPAAGAAFYRSDVSTGISGLHAFHESHEASGAVDVTTLGEIIDQHDLSHIDFLKIDVEGYDFAVLKGCPWTRLQPDVIECEFEDAKTLPLGHSYTDIADFLRAQGYAVYISEWHPVMRYGVRHQWRRVCTYPGPDMAADAWGNLLAFRDDPGLAAIENAFNADVAADARAYFAAREDARAIMAYAEQSGAEPGGVALAAAPPLAAGGAESRPRFYADAAERVHDLSPMLYNALRAVKRSAAMLLGRR